MRFATVSTWGIVKGSRTVACINVCHSNRDDKLRTLLKSQPFRPTILSKSYTDLLLDNHHPKQWSSAMSSSGSQLEQEPLLPDNGDEESQINKSEGYGTTKAQGLVLAGQQVETNFHGVPTDDANASTKTVPTTETQDEDPVLLEARRTVQRMLPILLIAVQSPPLYVYRR